MTSTEQPDAAADLAAADPAGPSQPANPDDAAADPAGPSQPANPDDADDAATASVKDRQRSRRAGTAATRKAAAEAKAKEGTRTTAPEGISSASIRGPEIIPDGSGSQRLVDDGAYVRAEHDAYYTFVRAGTKTPMTLRAFSAGALVRADVWERFASAGHTPETARPLD